MVVVFAVFIEAVEEEPEKEGGGEASGLFFALSFFAVKNVSVLNYYTLLVRQKIICHQREFIFKMLQFPHDSRGGCVGS